MQNNIDKFDNYDFDEVPSVIKLSGVSWGDRQKVISQLKPKTPLKIVRDYNNAYDKNAIFVSLIDGTQIGWIPKKLAEVVAPQMDAGFKWETEVREVIGSHETNYGVLINLYQV